MKHEEFHWQGENGLNIFAQCWQPEGESRAVVALVPGLGEHSQRYQHVAQAFSDAGYAVVGMDMPGHGKSTGKRGHFSFETALKEIDHLLEECARRFPSTPCLIYGHSLGGELVLYYLLKRKPDLKGAVVTSPGLAPGTPIPETRMFLARVMSRLAPSFTLDNNLDLNYLSHDKAVIEIYRNDPLVHGQISARLGLDLIEQGQWILAHADEINLPLLLMIGSEDQIVSVKSTRAFARQVPDRFITFKEWPGLYHETHNEPEKQQVIHLMLNWISRRL